MKSLIAAAALLALAGTASAADSKGNYAVLGGGAFTCADYLSGPPEASQIMSVWIQGYATALNQALPGVKDVTKGMSDSQLADQLYNYCNGKNDTVLADATRDMLVAMGGIKAEGGKKAKKKKAEAEPAAAEEPVPELRR